MCQLLMINDPQPCFLLLPSSSVMSHKSSCVTIIDAGRRLWAAPAWPHGYKRTITSSTCKCSYTFTFKAALADFACQWPHNVTSVNYVLLWPQMEVSFMMLQVFLESLPAVLRDLFTVCSASKFWSWHDSYQSKCSGVEYCPYLRQKDLI